MVTLENGGIVKSIHGGLYKDSIWYAVYGSKGRMECPREDAKDSHIHKIYVNADAYDGAYQGEKLEKYNPVRSLDEKARGFGHGSSDFYSMYHFVEKIKGNPEADIIDVYEALDMFLPGMFAYRSILEGSIPKEIPNLRDSAVRDLWRNDTACTDPKTAKDQLLPTSSLGTPEIDASIYERVKIKWDEECAKKSGTYLDAALKQGEKK
jgi:hypothetical protein